MLTSLLCYSTLSLEFPPGHAPCTAMSPGTTIIWCSTTIRFLSASLSFLLNKPVDLNCHRKNVRRHKPTKQQFASMSPEFYPIRYLRRNSEFSLEFLIYGQKKGFGEVTVTLDHRVGISLTSGPGGCLCQEISLRRS